MSADPLFSCTVNYHYCDNNPVNYRDPSGMAYVGEQIDAFGNIITMIENIIYPKDGDPLTPGHKKAYWINVRWNKNFSLGGGASDYSRLGYGEGGGGGSDKDGRGPADGSNSFNQYGEPNIIGDKKPDIPTFDMLGNYWMNSASSQVNEGEDSDNTDYQGLTKSFIKFNFTFSSIYSLNSDHLKNKIINAKNYKTVDLWGRKITLIDLPKINKNMSRIRRGSGFLDAALNYLDYSQIKKPSMSDNIDLGLNLLLNYTLIFNPNPISLGINIIDFGGNICFGDSWSLSGFLFGDSFTNSPYYLNSAPGLGFFSPLSTFVRIRAE